MNKLKSIFALLLVCGLAACSPSKSEDKVPSVRGDFKDQYEFIQAALDLSIHASDNQTKLSDEHYRLLSSKLNGLKSIVPTSGLLSKDKAFDNVSDKTYKINDWKILVKKTSVWSICNSANFSLKPEINVSLGSNHFKNTTNAKKPYAVPEGRGFDYESHAPQYSQAWDEEIDASEGLSVSWTDTAEGGRNCSLERVVIEYKGTHDKVIEAVQSFRAEVDAIDKELSSLRYNSGSSGNFPLQYLLKKQAERLRTAYEKLP